MSVLKVVNQRDVLWGNWFTEYYLKSEVDKVLADKDAEIQKWKAAVTNANGNSKAQVEETGEYLSQVIELKHKRCLDKAK